MNVTMGSQQYFNPYTGKTVLGFLIELFTRFFGVVSGTIPLSSLVADEIQVLVLAGVAASSALVGTFLVLRKMTMLANSLSHTILVGIVIAFFLVQSGMFGQSNADHPIIDLKIMLFASLIMGLTTTFLTELLTKWARLQEDASTGIVFTSLFSLGVIAVTVLMRNAHVGTEAVMGNVDALQLSDCTLVYTVFFINLVLFCLFFKEYKITTFDPGLSRSFAISPTLFNYLLMIQVSATTIAAFRAVGVLMVLAFITGPALTARLLTHDLKKMLSLAVLLGVVSSILGVALSRHVLSVYGIALSTAGVVVCTILVIYLAVVIWTRKLSRT